MQMELSIKWLGINGFEFNFQGRVILLDPYLTRNAAAPVGVPAYLQRHLPRADVIVVSHSHWDHMADVPAIFEYSQAAIIGSETTINVCRAFGIPEHKLTVAGNGDCFDFDGWSVTFLESLHKQPMSYPGFYRQVPPKPTTAPEFLEGGTFAPFFRFGNLKILDIGSANCVESVLQNIRTDWLFISPLYPDFAGRLAAMTQAKTLVPVHFDNFKVPLEKGLQSKADFAAFARTMAAALPDLQIRRFDLLESVTVPISNLNP